MKLNKNQHKLLCGLILASIVLFSNACTTNVLTGNAKVNNASLYYETKGTGTPIIFIHGFACDLRNWDDQFEFFSKDYKVVRYDMRGFGKSSSPDTIKYSHSDDLYALIEYLEIDKAILVGHSLGGYTAIDFAFKYPQMVKALILAEGGAYVKSAIRKHGEVFKILGTAIDIARKEGIVKGKDAWLGMEILDSAIKNPHSAEKLKLMTSDYSGWHWVNKDPRRSPKMIDEEELKEITHPTLLLVGELSRWEYHDLMEIHHANIPNSNLSLIKSSSHMLNLENPHQFNREIKSFLSEYTK